MPFVLLEEEEDEVKTEPEVKARRGFQLIEDDKQEIVQQAVAQKGFQLLPEEEQPPPKGEEPGWMTRAYRASLGKYFDFLRENDPEASVLEEAEDFVEPSPTESKEQATFQLLSQLGPYYPEEIRADMLADLANLNEKDNLFSEEGVEKMSPYVGEEYARQVLLEGIPQGKRFKRDIGFLQAIREGQQESATGILTGHGIEKYEQLLERSESEIPFLKRQAKNISKIIGDLPAMVVGGAAASVPVGGPETPWGAALAGAGAFGTVELIQSGYNEALRLVADHPELEGKTLDQLVALATDPEALKNIGLSTLEGGALGALVALNPLMKALEKTPLSKMFKIPIVKGAAATASEVATLTTVPAALRGQIPTAEDFLDNAFLVGGLKIAGGTAKKIADWTHGKKYKAEEFKSRVGDKLTQQDEVRIADARTMEEVGDILTEVEKRPEPAPIPQEGEVPKAPEKPLEEVPRDKAEPAKAIEPEKEIPKREEPKPVAKEILVEEKPKPKREGLEQPEQKKKEPIIGEEKKVPAKSEIIQIFKDAFQDTPIRIGKFRQPPKKTGKKILGLFKPAESVIRLKESGMVETAAHEFGHKLHYALLGEGETHQAQRQAIADKLAPYMDELKPISRYAPHDLEGFAEFTRMYVTNPEGAAEVAPAFMKFFEAELKKKAPDVLKSLHQAREMYSRYLQGDPVARTYSHIQSSFDRNLWQKSGDWFKKTFNLDRIKRNWLDDMYPIKRAVADTLGIDPVRVENWRSPLNAYIQARVLKGWVGKAQTMLFHETFNPNNFQRTGMGLKEILKPIKTIGDRRELSAYLVAKRDQILRKRGIKSGIDEKTINETVNRLKGKYDRIAGQLNAFQDRVLRYAVESGLYSEDQYKKMKELNPFYVPFYRVFEEGEKSVGRMTGGDTGRLQGRPTIKSIFGSTREIIDPLESIVNNTFTIVQNAEKNRLGQTLSKLSTVNPRGGKFMEKVPPRMERIFKLQKEELIDEVRKEAKRKDPFVEITNSDQQAMELAAEILPDSIERWRPTSWGPAENVITVYFDGKPKYYETTPEIAELYKRGGMGKAFAPAFTKILALPARMLRAGAILNPRFIQKNAIRDLVGAVVYTKHPENFVLDTIYRPLAGIAHAVKKDNLFVDWMKAGGGMATMQSIDKNVAGIKKGLGKGMDKIRPIAFMRRIGEISEEMNRLGEYAKAVDKMGTDRWQKEMAAFQSRDLSIDFAKYGYYAKALNQIIPFWNATIQGGDKLIRTLASKDPQVLQNFMVRATAGIVMPSLALEMLNYDDPDIQELDEATKDTNWLFKDPSSGDIVQIPVPFETGVLFHGLSRRLFNYLAKEDPRAFDGFLGSIGDAALPGFVPAAVQPFLEVWANKDFFRNRHIIHPSKMGLVSEEQYGPFTNESSRYIARALSYMPGIDELESHLASPSVVDHFIKTWGAGLGYLTLQFADAALEKAGLEPEAQKPADPLLRRYGLDAFTKRYPQAKTKSVENFYDAWSRWEKLDRSIKSKTEKRDKKGAIRLQQEQKKIAPPRIKEMHKGLSNIQKSINAIYSDPRKSPDEKRLMIDKLYLRQIQMARSFMNEIDKYQRKKQLKK